MNRFRSYVQRVITLLAVVILLITGVLYIVSSFIVRRSYESLSSAEMLAAVEDGMQMLSARSEGMPPEALHEALSPAFNPTGAFLVLLEGDGRLMAASDTAEPYLDALLSASVRLTETPAAVRVP